MIHSAMGGPATPEQVVMGMVESVTMGWFVQESIPAEKRWMNLQLGRDLAVAGRVARVTTMVAQFHSSVCGQR